jgi:steroid 5-alpha reductase family enzyme
MVPGSGEGILASRTRILRLVLFLLGTSVEKLAELGRKAFKEDPKNKGKLYTGGFFGLARHIKYGSYLLWSGLATFCGGLRYGAVIASLFVWYFTAAGIPPLDKYMRERVCSAFNPLMRAELIKE